MFTRPITAVLVVLFAALPSVSDVHCNVAYVQSPSGSAAFVQGRERKLMMSRVTHAQLDSREGAAAIQLNTIGEAVAPSITAIVPGKVAIAYQRTVHGSEYGSANRVLVRFVDSKVRRMRAIRR